ncbi:MAG: hypothetical protein VB106_14725 [Clostridiaceae bacterium]|nr:hypothetical protein [Clostridiaceae bacterium]
MAKGFMRGINHAPVSIPVESPPVKHSGCDEFLILILLFVLLAASPSLGLDSSYFFIIIMAVIGLGGINKAFGLKGPA